MFNGRSCLRISLFFFTDTSPTEIYTLSLHDALPILVGRLPAVRQRQGNQRQGTGLCRRQTESGCRQRSEETRLNSSHVRISYAVFCLKKKKNRIKTLLLDAVKLTYHLLPNSSAQLRE